jgi:hypothetical protein
MDDKDKSEEACCRDRIPARKYQAQAAVVRSSSGALLSVVCMLGSLIVLQWLSQISNVSVR